MRVLKQLGIWALCGAALVLGGYAAAMALGLGPTEPKYAEFPQDLKIHDLKISPLTEKLTVVGKITNSSDKTYRPGFVDLDILHGGALLHRCRQADMSYVPPHATTDFQMQCEDVIVSKLPKDASFRAVVNGASFK